MNKIKEGNISDTKNGKSVSMDQDLSIPNQINHNLPPVGVKVKVKLENGEWRTVKRTLWANSYLSDVVFESSEGDVLVKRSQLSWFYL